MTVANNKGVTLLEIMIVVGIVAILAAIAYPSYAEHARKVRRSDAQAALIGLGGAMERWFTENTSYLGAASGGGNTGAPAIFPAEAPLEGPKKYYDLTIQSATAITYEVRAAPKGAQAGDKCGTFTLTSQGVRGITGADAGVSWQDCWK